MSLVFEQCVHEAFEPWCVVAVVVVRRNELFCAIHDDVKDKGTLHDSKPLHGYGNFGFYIVISQSLFHLKLVS